MKARKNPAPDKPKRTRLRQQISVQQHGSEWVIILCPFHFGEQMRTHLARCGLYMSPLQEAFGTMDGQESVEILVRTTVSRVEKEIARFVAGTTASDVSISPSLVR
jgi:hypothetical protein